MSQSDYLLEINGHCPICQRDILFRARGPWHRSQLVCTDCPERRGSVPRERALALVLQQLRPGWRELAIHESSPANRGVSLLLRQECARYTGTHYHPDHPLGEMVNGFRNEDLEAQTFADNSFDLVITLDVFEHLFHPEVAAREIFRTLKPGGLHICTIPIYKHQVAALEPRAVLEEGRVRHLAKPEYHGNPIGDGNSLVTYHYGYDIVSLIGQWAPFQVTLTRFHRPESGIIGEMTDVLVWEKTARDANTAAQTSSSERTATK